MKAFIRRIYGGKLVPLCWTLFIIILLCLPGSAIPGAGIFSLNNLDKIVHFILFGGNVVLWALPLQQAPVQGRPLKAIWRITLLTIILGVALEYVQLYFIPNRSFDIKDIAADTAGAAVAFIYFLLRYRSKSN